MPLAMTLPLAWADKVPRANMLDALSVELVIQVLASLNHNQLIRISHVSRRLRIIVCQHEMPFILRNKIIDDENECDLWLAHIKSILDLDSRIALVFDVYGSAHRFIHYLRLKNWVHLLHAVSELFSSTCDDGHGRIVTLVAWLPQYYAEGLFKILSCKVVHLRELDIHGNWNLSPLAYHSRERVNISPVSIPSNLFRDGAPALQSVTLRDVIPPWREVPSFASTTYFDCGRIYLAELQRQLSLMPHLRSLSVETVLMPPEISNISTWKDSQPPLPGGINRFAIRELLIVSISAAQALAHVTTMATANARDATIYIDTYSYYCPCAAIAAFAVAATSASTSVTIWIDRDRMDDEDREIENENEDGNEDEVEQDDRQLVRFVVVGSESICDGRKARTVKVEIFWDLWNSLRRIIQEFFKRLPNDIRLEELKIAFRELKFIAPFELISRTTRALGRARLVVQEREAAGPKTVAQLGACGDFDFDMVWNWVPERDEVDLETPLPARGIRCSNLSGKADDALRIDMRFTTTKSRTLEVQPIFVDTVLKLSGFSRDWPVKVELGPDLAIHQKTMSWDPVGRAFRLNDYRF